MGRFIVLLQHIIDSDFSLKTQAQGVHIIAIFFKLSCSIILIEEFRGIKKMKKFRVYNSIQENMLFH